MPMSTQALKALLQAEKADALGTNTASELVRQRSKAMEYYLGDMAEDMPAPADRSKAVSTDVADTVEGLMPSLMEVFASSDETVEFEPVGPEDEEAAKQETDYTQHVFWQKNPGFVILHNFIKDALLQKNGVVKVYWDKGDKEEEETYLDVPPEVYAAIVETSDEAGFVVTEHTENEDGTHDVTLRKVIPYGCAKAENVPPEEFGITRRARSIRDADYAYHETKRSESVLVEQGYDAEQVKRLQTAGESKNEEDLARDTVEDEQANGANINDATRLITVTEHYIKCDYDKSGKARLWRVTTGGDDAEVLLRDGKPDVVKVPFMPFAAMTPVIMPHRFYGRSVADLVMDIQRIKTALTRGYLDQLYLTVNPPTEIAEAFAGEKTLDDLLTNRPGKIVRTKQPGGLIYHRPTSQGAEVLPAIEYFDAQREWRTGVTRQGQGIDAKALSNQSATASAQMFSMAQARMRLIARIFAETGIKDLFLLLHATIRMNDRQENTVRLRNQWVPVNPRQWKTRDDMTVRVALSGSKEQQMAFLMGLLPMQEGAMQIGLAKPANMYNTFKKVVELAGLKSVEPFFTDPEAVDPQTGQPLNPPPQPPPDPKLIAAQAKIEADNMKAQSDAQIKQQTAQIDAQLDIQRMEREHQFAIAEMQQEHRLKQQQMAAEFAQKQQQMQAEIALKAQAMAEELRIKEKMGILDAHVAMRTSQVNVGGEPG
jgi:hypothetical protein